MKFMVEFGDKKLLLDSNQLEILMTAIDGVPMLVDKHVGDKKGTHGYNNSYVHDVLAKRTVEWLRIAPIADDYIDTIKLAAKLEKDE